MFSPRFSTCLCILLAATAAADGQEKKISDTPEKSERDTTSLSSPKQEASGEVQVQFANGSSVRLTVLHDKLDVMTRYGSLAIPVKDVQKIDFGVRLPAHLERKVEAALHKLASAQYSERDTGERELLSVGAPAYPALLRASKHFDKEVARRAARLVTALREKLPEKELRDREEDIITTPGFTIVGRISPAALKVSSEYFGSVQLQLAQMRQLRSLRTSSETEIAIDAARYGSTHGVWMDTAYQSDGAATLAIKVSGLVDLYPQTPGQYMSGPTGINAGNGMQIVRGAVVQMNQRNLQNMAGALLGRVGEGGAPFLVGDHYEGNPGEGRLYLHIVPSPWNNASTGSYLVKISTKQ
jgi:hypothetical protein